MLLTLMLMACPVRCADAPSDPAAAEGSAVVSRGLGPAAAPNGPNGEVSFGIGVAEGHAFTGLFTVTHCPGRAVVVPPGRVVGFDLVFTLTPDGTGKTGRHKADRYRRYVADVVHFRIEGDDGAIARLGPALVGHEDAIEVRTSSARGARPEQRYAFRGDAGASLLLTVPDGPRFPVDGAGFPLLVPFEVRQGAIAMHLSHPAVDVCGDASFSFF